MIKNASMESIDLIISSCNPQYEKSESTSKLLNGKWFIQTIGERAERLAIEGVCTWAVLKELFGYADIKESLTVDYLDFVKSGFIIGQPSYDLFKKGNTSSRLYSVSFELAVIPNV